MLDHRPHPLTLPFKGTRDYLHGSDIVPALLALTGPVDKPSFQFHRMATRPLCARRVDDAELAGLRASEALHVLLSCRDASGATLRVAVLPDADGARPIERIAYDEAAMVADAHIDGRQITDPAPGRGRFAERVLALNKHLLNETVGPAAWVFSRLDLARGPVAPSEIRVHLLRAIGTEVYQSGIAGDGQPLGTLFFTRRPA